MENEVINEVVEDVEEFVEEQVKPAKKSIIKKIKDNKVVVAIVGATVMIVGGLIYVGTSGRFNPISEETEEQHSGRYPFSEEPAEEDTSEEA